MSVDTDKKRVIISLGGGLAPDHRPNERTQARLDATYFLYQTGNYHRIITTSGGTYRDTVARPVTEAKVGAEYLIARGIPANVILRQESALDTIAEPYFCETEFLEPLGLRKLTVVSNEFHIPRVRQLFELVLGNRYRIQYVCVDNRGMFQEELAKQRRHEILMMAFYKEQFDGITSGDRKAIEEYLFKQDPAYTGEIDEVHQKLTEQVSAIWRN